MKKLSEDSPFRLGTRGSDLALTQTRMVAQAFQSHHLPAEEMVITTRGDQDQRAFKEIMGDGFFTKELEYALLGKTADFAVHSAKDLPSVIHEELPWLAFGERESTRDILVIAPDIDVEDLENINDLKIGTSSPRRRAQLERVFPLADIVELRGNVPTRANKVLTGEMHAVVLAEAGLSRLGLLKPLSERGVQFLELPFVTAPCQGILGIQTRKENLEHLRRLANLELSEIALLEKSVLMFLGGGCHLEVGCEIQKKQNWSVQFFWRSENEQQFDFSAEGKSAATLLRDLFTHIGGAKSDQQIWITAPLRSQLKPHLTLSAMGFRPRAWPLIEPKPTWGLQAIKSLKENWSKVSSLVITSPFGADVFLKELLVSLGGIEALKEKKIFCVGQITQEPFLALGIQTEPLPMKATALALVPLLKTQTGILVAGTPESKLLQELKEQDIPCEFFELYRSFDAVGPLAQMPEDLGSKDGIVFTSASAVERFAKLMSPKESRGRHLYAIGPSTASKLEALGYKAIVSPRSGSWATLIQTIKNHTKKGITK